MRRVVLLLALAACSGSTATSSPDARPSVPDASIADASSPDARIADASSPDARIADFTRLPRFQELVPWTDRAYLSNKVDTWHFINSRFCYDPATHAVWHWNESKGCTAAREESYPIADFKAYLRAHASQPVSIALNVFFPDGTFVDRTMDGTSVTYSARCGIITADAPCHAFNLHDPRTRALFVEAYAAVIHSFEGTGNIIGWQIGYNVYQENLVGTFGFTAESLARFAAAWRATLKAESKLAAGDLDAVDALVSALDPNTPATWPRPVTQPDPVHYTDTPANRAQRFYFAYFQKFRQRDLAALHQDLFDTVKATAGAASWVEMNNAQIYTGAALPSPVSGPGYIQFGELPMLPVLDPGAPTLYSLGKDEGMFLQGYLLARCAGARCAATPGHEPYGVCPSTRGDACVCEPVENGCVDDWRLDRTIAYVLRDRAHGIRHRLNDGYVRSGYRVNGNDWAYDDSVRLADFKTLESLIFDGYATFEDRIDDSAPVQVRLYNPVWIQGALPRLYFADPYATGRGDEDFLMNLLESRGVKFQPINEDWRQLTTPVIVPYHDLLAPLLAEIPGYDPSKVIAMDAVVAADPSSVDGARAEAMMAAIAAKVPGLRAPITFNPLERVDPTNGWENQSTLRVGAYDNVVYNLSTTERCVGLTGGRSLRLAPFETRIVSDASDDHCR